MVGQTMCDLWTAKDTGTGVAAGASVCPVQHNSTHSP